MTSIVLLDPNPVLASLVLRIGLGLVYIAHALAKPLLFTFPGTVKFFETYGFPGWTVYPVFALELLGGLALLAGYNVRLVALALLPVMAGTFLVHGRNGWMFSAEGGGWEYNAFLTCALVALAILGDGRPSSLPR